MLTHRQTRAAPDQLKHCFFFRQQPLQQPTHRFLGVRTAAQLLTVPRESLTVPTRWPLHVGLNTGFDEVLEP